MHRTLITSAIAVAALAASQVAAASGLPLAAATETANQSNHKLEVKPATIVYSGDGAALLGGPRKPHNPFGHTHWTSWTTSSASGTGDNWIDDCTPNCAHGKYHGYPVNVSLSRVKTEHAATVFTRLTITYTGKKPSFAKKSFTLGLKFANGYFYWS